MARPRIADGGKGLQIWKVAANTLNKQSRTADNGWSSLGAGLTTHRKDSLVTKCDIRPRIWTDYLDKRPKLREMGMRYGTCNLRSPYRVGSLITVALSVTD
jgi:hypothetical protein